jgi:hypothetical protein
MADVLTFVRRLRSSLRSSAFEASMEAELQVHLELETELLVARGMDPREARPTRPHRISPCLGSN